MCELDPSVENCSATGSTTIDFIKFVPFVLKGWEVGVGGNEGKDIRFDIKAEVHFNSPLKGVPFILVNSQRC